MFSGLIYYIRVCWGYNKKFIILLICKQLIGIVSSLALIIFPRYILDFLFSYHRYPLAIKYLAVFVLVTLITGVLDSIVAKDTILERMRTFKCFQTTLGKTMMSAPLEQIESRDFLDLRSKAEQFIYAGGNGFGSIVESTFNIIGKGVTLLAYIGIISQLDVRIWIALIVLISINIVFNKKFQKRNIQINLEKAVQERRSHYFSNIFQDFSYGKEIRVNKLSDWLLGKYIKQLDEMLVFYKNLGRNNFRYSIVSLLLSILQQIIAYWYLIYHVILNLITVGQFTMYLSAITSFSSDLKELINTVISMNQYTDYFKSYQKYINVENIFKNEGKKEFNTENFEIEFKNVSFQYQGSKDFSVKDLNTKICRGDKIAIVGKNGAGKSTFIKLLLRIYKPSKGKILLNGIDIQTINYTQYINMFATVFQDYKLFSLPLFENIAFENSGSDENGEEKVRSLLHDFGLLERVDNFKNGIYTNIYKNFDTEGYTPSGGEEQRIAIIRALFKDAPVMILDEPTASLDPEAEYKINSQFNNLTTEKTCIFISHRLTCTKFCNKIIVFDNGHIIEEGTHRELLENNGEYAALYRMQTSYYDFSMQTPEETQNITDRA